MVLVYALSSNLEEVFFGVDAFILITKHKEYLEADLNTLGEFMWHRILIDVAILGTLQKLATIRTYFPT